MCSSLIVLFSIHAHAQDTAAPSDQMSEFFSWSEEAQRAHVGNSILMIAVVASQTAPEIAGCIDGWYGDSKEQRQSEAIEVMRELPQYTPEALILAVVEKACGKFPRR